MKVICSRFSWNQVHRLVPAFVFGAAMLVAWMEVVPEYSKLLAWSLGLSAALVSVVYCLLAMTIADPHMEDALGGLLVVGGLVLSLVLHASGMLLPALFFNGVAWAGVVVFLFDSYW